MFSPAYLAVETVFVRLNLLTIFQWFSECVFKPKTCLCSPLYLPSCLAFLVRASLGLTTSRSLLPRLTSAPKATSHLMYSGLREMAERNGYKPGFSIQTPTLPSPTVNGELLSLLGADRKSTLTTTAETTSSRIGGSRPEKGMASETFNK